MGVDFGGLAEQNIVRLGFGDLESSLELAGIWMTSATEVPAVTCMPTDMGVGRDSTTPAMPAFTCSSSFCF